jgi:hypothetical protein
VPQIIEYKNALQELTSRGLVCNYYNGGAFGFPAGSDLHIRGWSGGDDPTIRPQMRQHLRIIPPPAETTMSKSAAAAWQAELPGRVWVMPLSHWAFELDFGSKSWLPELLTGVKIDPQVLASRPDASPIEFTERENDELIALIHSLLTNLATSDFMLAFPAHPALCTIHHHRQLWWTGSNKDLIERIDRHAV